MDDDSNAEAGIATSHTKAAQNELDHAKGFERQHDWSINHLDERIFGLSGDSVTNSDQQPAG